MRPGFLLILLAALTLLSPAQGVGALETVFLNGYPHVLQKPDFCGEACLEMVFRKHGSSLDQDDVFNSSGLDPALGRGCATAELKEAAQRLGLQPGQTWYAARPGQAAVQLQAHFEELHKDLLRGVPSVVCMRYDKRPRTSEHFRLIVGYDQKTDEVVYLEPAEQDPSYRRMSRKDFLDLWPLKYQTDLWTVVRLRMKVRSLAAKPSYPGFSDADYAQHVRALKQRLPNRNFSIVIQEPFVVVGDEAAQTVRQRAKHTVGWAVEKLKASYFSRDPNQILDVWLFKDKNSYMVHASKLFERRPFTPYGYYSAQDGALVMNIATGGGTLVHEIVHPFMESNFPGCPDWFNEGLASLYEQCAEVEGRIHGNTNWRLAGLQKAIRAGELQSIKKLTTRAFYSDDDGTNYAMARYLCYYLQQKGLLRSYYRQFVQNAQADPTGYRTLSKVLGAPDLEKFQREWEKYVLGLRYP